MRERPSRPFHFIAFPFFSPLFLFWTHGHSGLLEQAVAEGVQTGRQSVVSVEALGDRADVWLSIHPDLPQDPLSLLQAGPLPLRKWEGFRVSGRGLM